MEGQKELNELFVEYIIENQETIKKLTELVNGSDLRTACRLTSRNDKILGKIEEIMPIKDLVRPRI